MAEPIDFYFDFSSPYGYLAANVIDSLADRYGRAVTWRPMLLGAVFKVSGQTPLLEIPLKGEYARRDLHRTARLMGLPFTLPDPFPFVSVSACRAFYWLVDDDAAAARTLAMALYKAAFVEGRSIARPDDVVEVAGALGHDAAAVRAALQDQSVKDRLRTEVDAAIAHGVFGSPFVIVDGEPFWGVDHLHQLERWLDTGGW